MRRIALLALSVTVAVCLLPRPEAHANPIPSAAKGSTLTVVNDTGFAIHHLFLSASDDGKWGSDQLGEDVLMPDESLTLTGIACDLYDIKVVDEDGDWCVVENVDLCKVNMRWVISDDVLSACADIGD